MSNLRRVQICADDFGLSDGVDLAILDLISRSRLSATSCMVAGQSLNRHAGQLAALTDRADIGLHLTFTDLAPLGPMPRFAPEGRPPALGALLKSAYTMQLDYSEIGAEIRRQIARFMEIFGRAPDFVDGHQHAHLLPAIRRGLWEAYDSGLLPKTTAIRNCAEGLAALRARGIETAKAAFIGLLSTGIAAGARRRGVPTNDSFRGVTAFHTDRPFGPTFKRFLSGPGERPLIMCHPGLGGYQNDPSDAIPNARPLEYAYLGGEDFLADLDATGVIVGRHPRG